MSKLGDANAIGENGRGEANNMDKHNSIVRMALPRNPALLSTGLGNQNQSNANNITATRTRRQSSHHSFPQQNLDRKLIRFENTYRMEPDPDHQIDVARVRRIANNVLETAVAGYTYDSTQAKQFTAALSERMRTQIKHLVYPRYKIIVQVLIGQKKGQDVRIVSRSIWGPKWDRHITIFKETANAYVTVLIFCVYTE